MKYAVVAWMVDPGLYILFTRTQKRQQAWSALLSIRDITCEGPTSPLTLGNLKLNLVFGVRAKYTLVRAFAPLRLPCRHRVEWRMI